MLTKSLSLAKKRIPANPLELKSNFDFNPSVVMIFFSPQLFEDNIINFNYFRLAFPDAILIGSSTAGEISKNGCLENSLSILAIKFQNDVHLTYTHTSFDNMDNSFNAGKNLAHNAPSDAKLLICFTQGTNINGSAFINGAQNEFKLKNIDCKITGGLAADNTRFKKTYLLTNQSITDNGAVGIFFSGSSFLWSAEAQGGWIPFGPARKITKSDNNILYELDGQKALDVYKTYLGEHSVNLPSSGLLFPFEMLQNNGENSGLIRTILAINESDGSLILAGEVDPLGYLRLMHAPADELSHGAKVAASNALVQFQNQLNDISNNNFASIFVSCVGRKLAMGPNVDDEIELALKELNFPDCAGFYSYGEICPFNANTLINCKQSNLHNQTMTITIFGEK